MNNQQTKSNRDILKYLLLFGIIGLGFNLYYKYDRYYLGEPTTVKKISVQDKPEYISSRRGTSRYSFKGADHNCRFWLSEGALDLINDNEQLKKNVESILVGDTVEIEIRKTDTIKLEDSDAKIRVVGFAKDYTVFIAACEVEAKDRKDFYINFGIPITCLLIWLVIQTKGLVEKRKKEA
ncbi:MAG: hypothetical protein ACK4EY_15460 [Flavipsychrobacter sp.]